MSIGESYRALGRAQKGHARGAPAYSVYVNRRIGRLLAAIAFQIGITANQATVISGIHTLLAFVALVVFPATPWTGVLVAILLSLGYAWDSADGQIARLGGGGTLSGEWLDHVVDAFKIASMHLVVLAALWIHGPATATGWALLPLGFSIVSVVTFFGMLLNDLLKGKQGIRSTHSRGGGTARRSLMLLPTDFGVLCLVFVLWGWTSVFLIAYAALAACNLVFLGAALVKWYREIRALDSGTPA